MEKKLYTVPAMRVFELAIQETMLASATGTGNNLTQYGDYQDSDFDDLFD